MKHLVVETYLYFYEVFVAAGQLFFDCRSK